jgi:pentatricopeptide repeat protein
VLLTNLAAGIRPTEITYGALANAYCKSGELDKAFGLLADMRRAEIKPDRVGFFGYLLLVTPLEGATSEWLR